MEILQVKPIIQIDAEDKKLLKNLAFRDCTKFSMEEYEEYIKNHPLYRDYDLTPELRMEHDRVLAEWREARDPSIRLAQRINLNPNLSDYDKWLEVALTYPLIPNGRILHFGSRLERE